MSNSKTVYFDAAPFATAPCLHRGWRHLGDDFLPTISPEPRRQRGGKQIRVQADVFRDYSSSTHLPAKRKHQKQPLGIKSERATDTEKLSGASSVENSRNSASRNHLAGSLLYIGRSIRAVREHEENSRKAEEFEEKIADFIPAFCSTVERPRPHLPAV